MRARLRSAKEGQEMRRYIGLLLAVGLVLGAASVATAGKAKPAKVFTDPSGDAGLNNEAVPGVDQGGFDLTEGTIAKKGKNLVFTVQQASMPASGTLPEGFRFLWHFDVAGKNYRLTVKSANIGKPDAASQTGTERVGQVDTAGHFRVESCTTDASLPINLSVCEPIAYLEGAFDPAEATFNFELPLKTLKLKAGKSVIAPSTMSVATTSGCAICWVPDYAERSLTPYTIIDAAVPAGSYKVPR